MQHIDKSIYTITVAGIPLSLRPLAFGFLATLAAAVFALTPTDARTAVPAAEERATELVENLGDEALNTLRKNPSRTEIRQKFEELLSEGFNIDYIARFVLGPYWRQSSPEQRDEYLALFRRMLVEVYASRFQQYSGQTFEIVNARVVSERGDPRDVEVNMLIRNPQAEDLTVDVRVRVRPDEAQIIDVAVAGVSLSLTQKEEFAAVIQRNGGRIDALIEQLRDRVGRE